MLLAGLNVIPLVVHAQDQVQINALVVKMEMQLQKNLNANLVINLGNNKFISIIFLVILAMQKEDIHV